MTIEKCFIYAKNIAEYSDFTKVHVGCVAIYKGKIIGEGYNSNKTHPVQGKYNRYRNTCNQDTSNLLPKLHAEIMCINSIKDKDINWRKVKIFVYRIRNDRPFGIARPCPACMNALKDLGICDIYYTTDAGYAHEKILH